MEKGKKPQKLPSVITQPADESSELTTDQGNQQPLSPKTKTNFNIIAQKLHSGEAIWGKDAEGNPTLVYGKPCEVILNYVDKSQANLIATPKTDKDARNRIDVCLEMIDFLKNNRAPKGVVLDKTKVHTKGGQYREGHEFQKLNEILGSGAMAGDIVVVKDKCTDTDHAQKTVMISEFRKEEILAWVDLNEEGLPPSLYSFHVEDNKIIFRMEKLENAITLRDVIDSHMGKIWQQNPELVRPFSLYMFHGLLSAVQLIHDKNWTHRDLHAGNVMLQEKADSLQLRVIDFGRANKLRGNAGYDVEGEKDDIFQVIRLFSAIYTGQEYESAHDLKNNYTTIIEQIKHLSTEDKTEVFQLIDAAMSVAESGNKMDETIQKISSRMGGQDETDKMMKKVAAILFNEKEFVSIHEDLGAKGDEGVDVCDAVVDLDTRADSIPDDFIQSLRLGIKVRKQILSPVQPYR